MLAQIAAALQTTVKELNGDAVPHRPPEIRLGISDLTKEETKLVLSYRRVDKRDRRTIIRMVEALAPEEPASRNVLPFDEELRYVEVLDAAAGLPLNSSSVEQEVAVPKELARGSGLAALRARGDSMSPLIENNDLVLVRGVRESFNYRPGDVVLVCVGESDYTIKRYGHAAKGKRRLYAENPAYEPLVVDTKNSTIEAVVIARQNRQGVWVEVERRTMKR